ncbi:hypothetical protein WN943_021226 [Citrus x changshan-huyou]
MRWSDRTGSSINLFTDKGKGKPRPRVLVSPKSSILSCKLAARLASRAQASARLCVFLLEMVDESLKLMQLLQLPDPGATCRFSTFNHSFPPLFHILKTLQVLVTTASVWNHHY